jgi:hypothetical protein
MAGILDCGGGKAISIYPDLGIARTIEGPPRDPDHTSFFETLAYNQRPSNAVFDDLGYKEIEGFPTHGFRVTVLGTQRDGDWNGKATQVTEAWVSDDLAMTMLEIHTNLKTKYESRDRRSHVSRQEPDPSLFEIPPGYKINPPQKRIRLPSRTLSRVPTSKPNLPLGILPSPRFPWRASGFVLLNASLSRASMRGRLGDMRAS